MKITKINESGKWWKGLRTTWACKNKNGDWCLFRGETKNKLRTLQKTKQLGSRLSGKEYIVLFLFVSLGISLALNIFLSYELFFS